MSAVRLGARLTGETKRPVVVAFQRFGPYHRARLRSAASRMKVVGLEMGTLDDYAWHHEPVPFDLSINTVFPGENPDRLPTRRLRTRFDAVLSDLNPSVVAVPGWGQRCALELFQSAKRAGLPTVLMSDSTYHDAPRHPLKEAIKSRIVQSFESALVAGAPHADYLRALGFPERRIFKGFDVVDNAHFASRGMMVSSSEAPEFQTRLEFLTVSRFLERKNLVSLIAAFDRFVEISEDTEWLLRIVGDGSESKAIKAARESSPNRDRINIDGFIQYEQLPECYASASCFILPSFSEQWGLVVNEAMASGLPVLVSKRCGCAQDLVQSAVNGFTFDPTDIDELAGLMNLIAEGNIDRKAFGVASQRIVADWDLDRFAEGLDAAVSSAMAVGARALDLSGTFLLKALGRK